jgi:predicted enzyme related to lactoylglutathione lyase
MVQRIVPDLLVDDLPRAVKDYAAVFRLDVVMDLGTVVTLADSDGHQLTLMSADPAGEANPEVSVFVDDVRSTYDAVVGAGLEIVRPLTAEPWGVTRFFFRDGAGHVINVGTHTHAHTHAHSHDEER